MMPFHSLSVLLWYLREVKAFPRRQVIQESFERRIVTRSEVHQPFQVEFATLHALLDFFDSRFDQKMISGQIVYPKFNWIKDKNPPIVKKSRGRKYRSHFTVHILPLHGDKWMHLYGITEIREMLADITQRKHLTVKTAKNVMNATLRAFFRDAVSEKVIEKNPFDELPKKWWPKTVTPEPDPFTEEERDRIIAYFFEKYWGKWPHACVFIYMQFWTGQRPSEATDRRYKDYDPRTSNLAITSSRT